MKYRSFIIAVLLFAFFVTGTVLAQETTEPSLVGVTWQWEHFTSGAEDMDVPTSDYTITFADDGTFHALADCNIVLGSYSTEDSTISILPGPTTLAMCSPESLGGNFTHYLNQAVVYSFTEDGKLLLEAPADAGTMIFSAQPQVTGSVTYRERMALLEGAIVRIQVQDVTLADAPTTIIGEQVIVTEGEQVPIPFTVSFPAAEIQENRTYSVSARITDGEGKLLFISDIMTPVITNDNPMSDIELMLVRVGS